VRAGQSARRRPGGAAGLTKPHVHQITSIGRSTIDRILSYTHDAECASTVLPGRQCTAVLQPKLQPWTVTLRMGPIGVRVPRDPRRCFRVSIQGAEVSR
jgi:hypothetical protein